LRERQQQHIVATADHEGTDPGCVIFVQIAEGKVRLAGGSDDSFDGAADEGIVQLQM